MVVHGDRGYYAESAITGVGLKNIAVTGEGIFDGAGDTWRPARKSKATDAQWKAFLARGGVVSNDGADWWPTKEAMAGEDYLIELSQRTKTPTQEELRPGRDFKRSPLVFLDQCETTLFAGVTLRNSPSGLFEPTRCADLTVRGVTLFNEWWAQNGDGMDINNCQNVLVYRCTLSTGDDAICMKANGTQRPGEDAALRNVIVAECTVYHGHGGFVVGGATDSGMRNLWATHCDFVGTDTGIRVKSGLGHGGLVHDVTMDHIYMRDIVNDAIIFDTHYDNTPVSASTLKAPLPRDPGKTPEFRDCRISDVYCFGAGTAIAITGLPGHPIHQVKFENVVITAKRGFHAAEASDIVLQNVKITTPESPAVTQKNTSNIQFMN
jgi:polygalacturonase